MNKVGDSIYIGENLVAFKPIFRDPVCSLEVVEYSYQEECNNYEHEIIAMEEYNAEIDNIRRELFRSGWWWSIDLPYEYRDGGLFVVHHRWLDWETTFEQPWEYPKNGYDISPFAREGFSPAVRLSMRPLRVGIDVGLDVEDDDYLADCWIIWSWDDTEQTY